MTRARPPMQRWENANLRRFYAAFVQRNLFGEWEVVRVWGGIGSRQGGLACDPIPDEATGLLAMAAIDRRRAQRGYKPLPTL